MRAAVFHGRCDLRLEDVPEPQAGPGDVKLRVFYNGICGSDLHEYFAGPMTSRSREPHPLTGVTNPVIMGHELCGEVVDVGDGVRDLEIGDRVAVEPVETCGRCLECRTGHYNHCRLLAIHGYNRHGGLADYTLVRRSMAHKLPRSLTARQGALVEPMAIAWSTARRCRVESGQTVAIHGAGPIGIGVLLTLLARGVRVIVSDPSPVRRSVVAALGASTVLDPREVDVVAAIRDLTGGRGADASVDAAGVPAAVRAGLLGTAIDGNFVVVAIHEKPIEIAPFDLLMPEVHITGVALSCNDFPSVIDAMTRNTYPMDGWVTTVPFANLLEDGFERLSRQEALKILVDINGVAA